MTIVFFRDHDVWSLLRAAAAACRDRGQPVRIVKRRLRRPVNGRLVDEIGPDILAAAEVIVAAPRAPVTAAMMDAAPRLRALVSPVAGVDSFDVPAATERAIVVGHGATEEQYVSMAEGTIALMLALAYRVPRAHAAMAAGWRDPPPGPARMIAGATVGLLGYGPIARHVARRLAGWDLRLLAHTRSRAPGERDGNVAFTDLDTLLADSDILSLHLREVPETRHILNAETIGRMKPGALLVNTGRGSLVDEAALAQALRDGRLAGAALDAFEVEPLAMDSPLRGLPNVVHTPHNVGHTRALFQSMDVALKETLARLAAGEPPVIVRNPEVLDAWRARWGG